MKFAANTRRRAGVDNLDVALDFNNESDVKARKAAVEANTALKRLKTLQN